MKLYNLILFFILFICNIFYAQPDLWNDISESGITLVGKRYIIPDSYRTVELNLEQVNSLLKSAPMEYTSEAVSGRTTLILPMPDGTNQKFKFWESPTMEPELQTKFPEIRTYTGQGIDDPYASLKFDLTPEGFHAQILSPNGRVFIDPHNQGDIRHYISYYSRDFHNKDGEFQCQLLIDEYQTPEPENFVTSPLPPTGPQLRTYRLANAATGEYTAFHGGTVALGLAAVTTSVNRVNGVYEKEVAVRMILVANNNLIIYTNPNTDPYTNNDGGAMLSQNISNLNSVIGSANYDIGHVFSTGGGGVAYLGCVCTSSKAGGVTGSPTPIGDPFDIDYVAHEMGHQFGANHSFNGNEGSCSGSNRNASTAYEPGSGSTIMAYAGICGTQDLQAHSDAYFHVISFDEIRVYTNSGSGNGCAVITNTGNSAPIVTVPSGGFYIPKSTPFSLTGSATDPNSDPITYCWEEFDLGPAGHPNSPSGNAPIFRSFSPVTSSTRTFPKLSDLLNNTQTIGEILPTYSRNLTFRLTARDNRAGGGGVDYAQMSTFYVDGNSGPFVVTSPNTNVSWPGNSNQTITWNVANTSSSPVNCSNVKILLSTNGGNNFNTVLLASTPNDGSELVTIPNLPTSQARIKVEAVGNIFFDISNTNFTIVNNTVVNDPSSFNAQAISSSQIDLTFVPNASNNNVVIVWNYDGVFTAPSGTPPGVGGSFAGGILLYNGINSPVNHTSLMQATTYYYKAFSYNGTNYSTGLTASATTLSSLDFGVNFLLTDNCANSVQLVFGTASGATDCFDLGLDIEAPPPPPAGAFDGRFSVCGLYLFTDIRGTNFNQEREWNILYSPATGCGSVNFSWNPAHLPPDGYFHLVDPVYGNIVNVNMRTANHYNDLSGLDHLRIKFNYQINSRFNVSTGWNMLSLPINVSNNNYLVLFPNAVTGTLYRYSNSYIASDTVGNCFGYWLKFPTSQIVDINGSDRTECVLNLSAGWNLIGGPNCNVPLNNVIDPGGIIIPGTLYGYSGSYTTATTIDGTKAYWIKTNSAGTITINCGSQETKLNKELTIAEETLADFSKIEITDSENNKQMLYFNSKLKNLDIENFSLPPLPPQGSFDARFIGDYRLSENDEATIQIQASDLQLSFTVINLNQDESSQYILRELVNGTEVESHEIADGSKIIISRSDVTLLKITKLQSLPSVFSLEQNYPNPFNPSTTIKFSLPENSNVLLSIYNTLGQKITELVNTNLNAGTYSFSWDASEVASGVYIYKLTTDKSISIKKMILLR
jgi:hypothetical protein